ncbi:hypothetical protein ACJX0J_040504, partial [Zea mays]
LGLYQLLFAIAAHSINVYQTFKGYKGDAYSLVRAATPVVLVSPIESCHNAQIAITDLHNANAQMIHR